MTEPVAELPASGPVELGGRLVNLRVTGSGDDVVVLLGGCGVPIEAWDEVAARLEPDLTVVRLDRPGLGGTPWPGTLPRLEEEVRTLEALGDSLAGTEPRKAVWVGHSMAGLHVEALTRRRPDLVAALVLVESSVSFNPRRPGSGRVWRVTASSVHSAMALRPVRTASALGERMMVRAQSRLAKARRLPAEQAPGRHHFRDADTVASVIAEQAAYAGQVWDLARSREVRPWPRTRTVVLSAAEGSGQRWLDEQAELAALLRGRHVIIDRSRHLMMLDRPELVADTVRQVLAGGRRG